MKVGVIGLGAIAQKAYLPILAARGDLDIVLATRNSQTLDQISRQYRIPQKVGSVEELIHTGIQATFVHAATEAHFQICLLYTSDAADDLLCVDLGGRRIIQKKTKKTSGSNVRY